MMRLYSDFYLNQYNIKLVNQSPKHTSKDIYCIHANNR
jgi:hypothetical protein